MYALGVRSKSATGKTLRKPALALTLLAAAGCVDAIGYLRLGGHFVMSGNTMVLGVSMARDNISGVFQSGLLVALFVTGPFLGYLVADSLPQRHVALLLTAEAALLLNVPILARFLPQRLADDPLPFSPLIAPLVLAMGLQNATLRRVGSLSIGLTYITGALAHLGAQLAYLLTQTGERREARRYAGLYVLFWSSLALGGVGGGLLYLRFDLQALFVPGGVLILCALRTLLDRSID